MQRDDAETAESSFRLTGLDFHHVWKTGVGGVEFHESVNGVAMSRCNQAAEALSEDRQ